MLEPSFAPREKSLASRLSDERFQDLCDSDDPGIQAVLDVALDSTSPELDRSVTQRRTWNLIHARGNNFDEKIHLKELRAVPFGLRHLCREHQTQNTVIAFSMTISRWCSA